MPSGEFEVVVVGAGAAGIAAGRKLRAAGVNAVLLEARSRVGGRAWTVHDASGHALDLGCEWLHSADRNPWSEIAEAKERAIDKSPPPWERASAMIGVSAADAKAFRAALGEFRGAIDAFAEDEPDQPVAGFLAPGNRWNPLIDAVSTYYSGAEVDRVSARDLQRYDDTGVNWRVADGYGALIESEAAGLNVERDCEVIRIDHRERIIRIDTSRGSCAARAVIVTLPSAVIAQNAGLFLPALPEKISAAEDLPLGLADKLFMSLADAEGFEADSRAFGSLDRTATAAYQFRGQGRPVIEAYFGGDLAQSLEAGGAAAFFDFACEELTGLFGSGFRKRIAPLASHGWRNDVWSRGSYSYASPGRADSRARLAAPVDGRLFFAGEACSIADYSTAHGAYRTGIAAADEVVMKLREDRDRKPILGAERFRRRKPL